MGINEAVLNIGKFVINELDSEDGRYCIFEVDPKRKTAKIQRPDQSRHRWIDIKFLSF